MGQRRQHLAKRPGDEAEQRAEWMTLEAEKQAGLGLGGLVLCAEVLGLSPKGTEELMRT